MTLSLLLSSSRIVIGNGFGSDTSNHDGPSIEYLAVVIILVKVLLQHQTKSKILENGKGGKKVLTQQTDSDATNEVEKCIVITFTYAFVGVSVTTPCPIPGIHSSILCLISSCACAGSRALRST